MPKLVGKLVERFESLRQVYEQERLKPFTTAASVTFSSSSSSNEAFAEVLEENRQGGDVANLQLDQHRPLADDNHDANPKGGLSSTQPDYAQLLKRSFVFLPDEWGGAMTLATSPTVQVDEGHYDPMSAKQS